MKILDIIAWILVIVGGINWGCVGFFEFNLVDALFGTTMLASLVYDLVGISAIYLIFRCKKFCGTCSSKRS